MGAPPLPTEPLLRSFGSLDEMTAARRSLLDAGLPADILETRVIEDEAGPVEGNFLVGNGRTTHGGPPGGVLAGPEVPYEQNFSRVVTRGGHLLLVHARNAQQRELAQSVLKGHAAVDPAGIAATPSK
jgi:hypothetical protein